MIAPTKAARLKKGMEEYMRNRSTDIPQDAHNTDSIINSVIVINLNDSSRLSLTERRERNMGTSQQLGKKVSIAEIHRVGPRRMARSRDTTFTQDLMLLKVTLKSLEDTRRLL